MHTRDMVTISLSARISSAGIAQGWQSWGQGFEPPQLHHLLIRTSQAPAPRHLRAAGTAVPVALARHRRLTPVGRCKLKTVGVYGPHARSRMLRCGSYQPMGLVSSAERSKTPPE